jgi:hypothetical protein
MNYDNLRLLIHFVCCSLPVAHSCSKLLTMFIPMDVSKFKRWCSLLAHASFWQKYVHHGLSD